MAHSILHGSDILVSKTSQRVMSMFNKVIIDFFFIENRLRIGVLYS
jgi:hypothetical protein